MKTLFAALVLSGALVAGSSFDASAQKNNAGNDGNTTKARGSACRSLDRTSQAYKDCIAKQPKTTRAKKSDPSKSG